MKTDTRFTVVSGENRIRYDSLHLRVLLERIVEMADADALVELHDRRTLFTYLHEKRLLFADYVDRLRLAAEVQSWGTLSQQAYDLTIDKFSRLPRAGEGGIDCRNYFRAALKVFAAQPAKHGLQAELLLAGIIQRLVHRHFELSLRESQRSINLTRFEWTLPSGSIQVLLPRSLSGSARRRWLEEHVPNPNPHSPGECDRAQMIVSQHFQSGNGVPFDDESTPESVLHPSDLPGYFESSLSVDGLALTVANEKSERLLEQRPAIQQLGAARLKAMIQRIFEDIGAGDFREGAVAREWGLSNATFSRFAGGHWEVSMPDLWRNTAQVLSSRKDLVELIRELGIRPRIVASPTTSG